MRRAIGGLLVLAACGAVPPLFDARTEPPMATLADGGVLIVGGGDTQESMTSAERWDHAGR